jgi:hypothetical protein
VVAGEISRVGNPDGFARTFAHEIGHFLGLSHNHKSDCPSTTAGRNRLMAQTRCQVTAAGSTLLTNGEGTTIRGHCSVQDGC